MCQSTCGILFQTKYLVKFCFIRCSKKSKKLWSMIYTSIQAFRIHYHQNVISKCHIANMHWEWQTDEKMLFDMCLWIKWSVNWRRFVLSLLRSSHPPSFYIVSFQVDRWSVSYLRNLRMITPFFIPIYVKHF